VWTRVKICFRWWHAFVWALPTTNGFADKVELLDHFARHAGDFGATSEAEYEMLADRFLGRSLAAGVLECKRSGGDIIRFDQTTDEYGVLSQERIIRTYFKPIPRVLTGGRKGHRHATNLAYFHAECLRL